MKGNTKVDPFAAWIESNDITTLAEIMNVEPRTIYRWRAAGTYPSAKHMRQIVSLSNGRVKYSDIIERQK